MLEAAYYRLYSSLISENNNGNALILNSFKGLPKIFHIFLESHQRKRAWKANIPIRMHSSIIGEKKKIALSVGPN